MAKKPIRKQRIPKLKNYPDQRIAKKKGYPPDYSRHGSPMMCGVTLPGGGMCRENSEYGGRCAYHSNR